MIKATILDMEAITEAQETMKAKFPTMVQYFIEDTEAYISNIKDGIDNAKAEKIISPAHTLKSSSRQMGATHISNIARKIEMMAREQSNNGKNDMAAFAPEISALETAFDETKEAFKQLGA